MGDDGLGGIGDRAMTFAGWRRGAVFACGGTRGGKRRGWRLGSSGRREGIQWVLAVPYIPVQGSPGVFWESLGVGDRVFGRGVVIGGVEIAYMRVRLLGRRRWAVRGGVVLTT